MTLAILGGTAGAGANPARPPIPNSPPPVPRIVNANGTLNLAVVTRIPAWEPPGYGGPDRFPSASSFGQNLTPTEVSHLSVAQRLNAHVSIAP